MAEANRSPLQTETMRSRWWTTVLRAALLVVFSVLSLVAIQSYFARQWLTMVVFALLAVAVLLLIPYVEARRMGDRLSAQGPPAE